MFSINKDIEIKIKELVDKKYKSIEIIENFNNSEIIQLDENILIENNNIFNSKNIEERNKIPIKNYYNIHSNIDFHIIIYYINDYEFEIIIRRMDKFIGWENSFYITIWNIEKTINEKIKINSNYKNSFINNFKTKIKLDKVNLNNNQIIPKIIIQTAKKYEFTELHYNVVMTFLELNPEYQYKFFSDEDCRLFIKSNFNSFILETYDKLVPGAYKADLFRYCYLYINGGCYFDCKMILREPLRNWVKNNDEILICQDVKENRYFNGVILVKKEHPLLKEVINSVKNLVLNNIINTNLGITGPSLFYKVLHKYMRTNNIRLYHKIIGLNNNIPISHQKRGYRDFIMTLNTGKIILHKFYNDYYKKYNKTSQLEHYGKLFTKGEVYYKNLKEFGKFKFYVYPNKFNDTFDFEINNDNLIIKRIDKNNGWGQDLIIKLINQETNKEKIIKIGNSKENKKIIKLYNELK
jgi:mannosyltransferase OCH1-like enzyme